MQHTSLGHSARHTTRRHCLGVRIVHGLHPRLRLLLDPAHHVRSLCVRYHHITATRTRVSRQNKSKPAGASAMRAMRAAGVASVPEWHSHGTAAPPGVREYCYVMQPAHCTDAAVARNGQCSHGVRWRRSATLEPRFKRVTILVQHLPTDEQAPAVGCPQPCARVRVNVGVGWLC